MNNVGIRCIDVVSGAQLYLDIMLPITYHMPRMLNP